MRARRFRQFYQFLAELQRPENIWGTEAVYASRDELIADIAQAYRAAVLAFYEAGCRSLQLDDCTWGMLCDQNYWKTRHAAGEDVSQIAETYARLNEAAIRDLPEDLVVTTHVCRGNYHSTWASSGDTNR